MLRRQDVGHRIVVRRLAGSRDGRPVYSDALGELTELTDTHLTVNTASGPVRVPLGEVHRAKLVPAPRRAAARQITALELAADEAWPAPVRERLGDWWLRAADGWTGRANSLLPAGSPGMPVAEAVHGPARALPPRLARAQTTVTEAQDRTAPGRCAAGRAPPRTPRCRQTRRPVWHTPSLR